MSIFKTIQTANSNGYTPFKVNLLQSGEDTLINVEKRSVIYRSFNLKDMMIWSGYIDDKTKSTIESIEGSITGHIIQNLATYIKLPPEKENHIIYLKVGIGPNLYATGAEIIVSDIENPWSGYPEPFMYNPPIEFDEEGNLKSNITYRRQTAAIFPLAYITNNLSDIGTAFTLTKGEGEDKEVKVYKLVQTIDYNIMMTTFNYDGNPVAYGIPFMNPFFWYSSSSTSS